MIQERERRRIGKFHHRRKQASIPSVNVCMNCHKAINKYEGPDKLEREDGTSVNGTGEIEKLYAYAGWNPATRQYNPDNNKDLQLGTLQYVSDYGDGIWQHEVSRRWKKSLFYKDYPLDNFQVVKQNDTHSRNGTWETFLAKNPHADEYYNPWQSAIRAHQALIDPKFFIMKKGQVSAYTKYFTPWYPIGRLNPEPIQS